MMKRVLILCLTATFMIAFSSTRSAEKKKNQIQVDVSKLPPPSDKKDVTYDGEIKSIFDKSCAKCHGPEKPKAKLRLDNLEGALKGGEDGKVILPGKSAESLLVI